MTKHGKEDSRYDGGGNSFGSISSNLIAGAAGYVGGGRGRIMGDLIDFLDRNVNGFKSGYDDNKALSQLHQCGNFDKVVNEMDETDILVKSLDKMLNTAENKMVQA